MENYPGMTLSNEVRESISLDEDDLSDVEDEVFIRDGKTSYKTAEDIYVKRPLMAPRRKLGRHNISARIKNRPPCKALCRPCCYFLGALSVLIGLIVLVIILVSIFPLPLDRIHNWIASKFVTKDSLEEYVKLLPCSDYKITDVWTTNLPKLTTDSPINLIDINNDGVEDVLFGFGTGENYGILPHDIYCTIFMGVPAPCEGGLIALNGLTGNILWKYWTNDTIYYIHCAADINKDGVNDCLLLGVKGTIILIDTKNGSALWNIHFAQEDIVIGSFIADQNNDNVSDVITSKTNLLDGSGSIVLLSGKTGEVLAKVPVGAKSFYMPQTLYRTDGDLIIIGTGGPTNSGNLSIANLKSYFNNTSPNYGNTTTIFQDHFSGVMIQSVIVDITGDGILDIITAMYNSSVVALNGQNFSLIWNFKMNNSQTNSVPIPGYFNFDNVTDFLIIYETYDSILKYNYTQTYILDGKTGTPIYKKPISDSVKTQIGGLSLSMESYGYDMFLFWTSECKSSDVFKKIDFPLKGVSVHPLYENCNHKDNTTVVLKLNILNQFDQPPGIEIYNSLNRTLLEFNATKSPMQILKEYLRNHPKLSRMQGQAEVGEGYDNNKDGKIGIHKYGNSNFRHKENRQGIPLLDNYETYQDVSDRKKPYNPYYDSSVDNLDDYNTDEDLTNKERNLVMKNSKLYNRDPRSKYKNKENLENPEDQITLKKKNLNGFPNDMYSYKNIRLAKNRLLHDLNDSPDDILSDIFYKNLANKLRTSKFEQRDLSSYRNRKAREESINKMIEEDKKIRHNSSFNLWNLESEKENNDKKDDDRKKRDTNYTSYGSLRKVTTVGAITDSLKTSNESTYIDVIFLTYWQPLRYEPRENLEEELAECVEEKLVSEGDSKDDKTRTRYFNECVLEQSDFKRDFIYFNDIYKLNLGQMTVYRLTIQCQCNISKENERCAKFSPKNKQGWPNYLGRKGDGIYLTRQNLN